MRNDELMLDALRDDARSDEIWEWLALAEPVEHATEEDLQEKTTWSETKSKCD